MLKTFPPCSPILKNPRGLGRPAKIQKSLVTMWLGGDNRFNGSSVHGLLRLKGQRGSPSTNGWWGGLPPPPIHPVPTPPPIHPGPYSTANPPGPYHRQPHPVSTPPPSTRPFSAAKSTRPSPPQIHPFLRALLEGTKVPRY